MIKDIYSGDDRGLYNWRMFQPMMDRLNAEQLLHGRDLVAYHLVNHNVCVVYSKQEDPRDGVVVVLSGTEEGIGRVEQIILQKAQQVKQNFKAHATKPT